jgi:hypothetical protein
MRARHDACVRVQARLMPQQAGELPTQRTVLLYGAHADAMDDLVIAFNNDARVSSVDRLTCDYVQVSACVRVRDSDDSFLLQCVAVPDYTRVVLLSSGGGVVAFACILGMLRASVTTECVMFL